jgi:hypothetical protein
VAEKQTVPESKAALLAYYQQQGAAAALCIVFQTKGIIDNEKETNLAQPGPVAGF